ncbi:MAG: hypothetical protein B7Z36_06090 [Novosphingobium sp. 12-63-9]|nr:MAG: hypothetical protein B7Z36_06090 [Novosphingobium sp. 12-63-9]
MPDVDPALGNLLIGLKITCLSYFLLLLIGGQERIAQWRLCYRGSSRGLLVLWMERVDLWRSSANQVGTGVTEPLIWPRVFASGQRPAMAMRVDGGIELAMRRMIAGKLRTRLDVAFWN